MFDIYFNKSEVFPQLRRLTTKTEQFNLKCNNKLIALSKLKKNDKFNYKDLIYYTNAGFSPQISSSEIHMQDIGRKKTRSKHDTEVKKEKKNKASTVKSKARLIFKSFDLFGQDVKMTWKGRELHTTFCGAVVSIPILIILFFFVAFKLKHLILMDEPTVTQTTLMRAAEDDMPFRPQDLNFEFAFGVNTILPPEIGYFTAQIVTQRIDENTQQKVFNYSNIPIVQCKQLNDPFTIIDQSQVNIFGINSMYCLNSSDYQLYGNYYGSTFEYLQIKLFKCQNGTRTQCANSSSIDSFLDKLTFDMPFINTMFSKENYNHPIDYFIDDQLFFMLDPSRIRFANFYIREQEAILQDDLLQVGQRQNLKFFQVLRVQDYDDNYTEEQGYIVCISIRAEQVYDQYTRRVDDILGLMADVGGLREALLAIGTFFVSYIASRQFTSKIVKQIYHVRRYDNLEHEAKRQLRYSFEEKNTLERKQSVHDQISSLKEKETEVAQGFK